MEKRSCRICILRTCLAAAADLVVVMRLGVAARAAAAGASSLVLHRQNDFSSFPSVMADPEVIMLSLNVLSSVFGVIGSTISVFSAMRQKNTWNLLTRSFALVMSVVGLMVALNALKRKEGSKTTAA